MKYDKSRRRKKGRLSEHSFTALPHYILQSPEFGSLGAWPVKLLIELAGKYRGMNNGDLSAAYSQLKRRGWNSPGTLNMAIKALVNGGWLVCTRHGGKNRCSLYAVTWWEIDPCDDKCLEVKPETVASHKWRKTNSAVDICSKVVGTCRNEVAEDAA